MHMNDFNFLHTKKIMPIDFILFYLPVLSVVQHLLQKKHIPGRLMFM